MNDIRDKIITTVVPFLAAGLLLSLSKTLRWRVEGLENNHGHFDPEPTIFAFWHNRQILLTCLHQYVVGDGPNVAALVSLHRDGRIIAKAGHILGMETVSGSSTRGGLEAMREMTRRLVKDSHIGITPDGPRGPLYKVKGGVIKLANISGRRLFPCVASAERYWRLGSWDRLFIPKPFSRCFAIFGPPIPVPQDLTEAEHERVAKELETALNKMTERADAYWVEEHGKKSCL